jgi:hypothetical protein
MEKDYINNNTRFIKPEKKYYKELFLRNVVFITSNKLEQNLKALKP